jgi:fibronectin type 3 domain-containing protein
MRGGKMLKLSATLFLILILFSLTGCGDVHLGTFTPAAPSDVRAQQIDGASGSKVVLLTWSPSEGTTPSQGATFTVYRGETATGTVTAKIKVAAGLKSTSYIDTSAAAATSFYQVTATIYGTESAPSQEVTVAGSGPAAALVLSGTTASATNTLTWTAAPDATGYQLYRGVTPSGSLTDKMPWHTSGSASTSFTDSTVSAGLTYYYQVVSLSLNGHSLPSNEVAITTR